MYLKPRVFRLLGTIMTLILLNHCASHEHHSAKRLLGYPVLPVSACFPRAHEILFGKTGKALRRIPASSIKEAQFYLQMVLQEDPNHVPAHNLMGLTEKMLGNAESAIGHFKQALAIAPNDQGIRLNLANTYLDTKRYADAASTYEQLIKLSPLTPLYHFNIAKTYEQLKMFEKALEHYLIARELDESYTLSDKKANDLRLYLSIKRDIESKRNQFATCFAAKRGPAIPLTVEIRSDTHNIINRQIRNMPFTTQSKKCLLNALNTIQFDVHPEPNSRFVYSIDLQDSQIRHN